MDLLEVVRGQTITNLPYIIHINLREKKWMIPHSAPASVFCFRAPSFL